MPGMILVHAANWQHSTAALWRVCRGHQEPTGAGLRLMRHGGGCSWRKRSNGNRASFRTNRGRAGGGSAPRRAADACTRRRFQGAKTTSEAQTKQGRAIAACVRAQVTREQLQVGEQRDERLPWRLGGPGVWKLRAMRGKLRALG